ncbi:MAG TPA: dipeptide epimerase [Candidatus Krumholzibacteria bacterium]|nr:dipeptide epimerase [Candidatus Krumholzibacteria bacterium]
MSARDSIVSVDVWPVDVPLDDPFIISRGRLSAAECAFVRVRLSGGDAGYGEIAPFAALTGETRDGSMADARRLAASLAGRSASQWRELSASLEALAPESPAARAGLECALVDALARARGAPLHALWSHVEGARPDVRVRETDMTLPMLDDARVAELAQGWYERGFRVLKLKVGDPDVDKDLARVDSLARRYPDVSFVLDANQGYDRARARAFVDALRAWPGRVRLVEQPLSRDDLAGMAELRTLSTVPIVADESVFTLSDVHSVIAARAADVVNLKIMKSGLAQTIEIARAARAAGLGLMIGGMMETRLAMGVSFSLVLGLGGIDHLDLDTPLLMSDDPWVGGYAYDGPRLLPCDEPGLGMQPRES